MDRASGALPKQWPEQERAGVSLALVPGIGRHGRGPGDYGRGGVTDTARLVRGACRADTLLSVRPGAPAAVGPLWTLQRQGT
jgi:hypothetical protein